MFVFKIEIYMNLLKQTIYINNVKVDLAKSVDQKKNISNNCLDQ